MKFNRTNKQTSKLHLKKLRRLLVCSVKFHDTSSSVDQCFGCAKCVHVFSRKQSITEVQQPRGLTFINFLKFEMFLFIAVEIIIVITC